MPCCGGARSTCSVAPPRGAPRLSTVSLPTPRMSADASRWPQRGGLTRARQSHRHRQHVPHDVAPSALVAGSGDAVVAPQVPRPCHNGVQLRDQVHVGRAQGLDVALQPGDLRLGVLRALVPVAHLCMARLPICRSCSASSASARRVRSLSRVREARSAVSMR